MTHHEVHHEDAHEKYLVALFLMFVAFCRHNRKVNIRFMYHILCTTHLNISIVNSENFACSTAEPTRNLSVRDGVNDEYLYVPILVSISIPIRISCSDRVICGDRSHGGVVSGLNLEPEPLNIKKVHTSSTQQICEMARAFALIFVRFFFRSYTKE